MEFNEIKEKAIEGTQYRLKKKNIENTVDLIALHLTEEVGEIMAQIMNGKLKRKEVDVKNIGEEISDSIILLMTLSKHYNINLEKAILEKIEDVRSKN